MRKVGYFSPMPPAATGVADYSAALLPYLRALGLVEVNPATCEVGIYHIGNNLLHREIYERALARPGIVVLHDATLNHFYLGLNDRNAYLTEFISNYGEWALSTAETLWEERARAGADPRYFEYPMLKRIVLAAKAVIVHNPLAAKVVREHVPEASVVEIPHLFVMPKMVSDRKTFRESLRLNAHTLLVGAFGHQRETKRLPVLVRAFDLAVRAGTDARLLISGEFVSKTYARAIEPLLGESVLRTGYLAEEDFWRYAAATDVCVNLRYPTAAETSGMAIRMMGIGKPVVFTNDAAIERFPQNSCLRVDVGPAEEEMLAGYIAWLAREPEAGAAIGRNAAAHIAVEHAPEKIAAAYWDVINTV
jgi:glycosyltransferase involved in cell wall biosynthesis